VYFISQRLDGETQEAWEMELGNSTAHPRYSELENFLESRVRALESLTQEVPRVAYALLPLPLNLVQIQLECTHRSQLGPHLGGTRVTVAPASIILPTVLLIRRSHC